MSKLDDALTRIYGSGNDADDGPSGADFSFLTSAAAPKKEEKSGGRGFLGGGLLDDVFDVVSVPTNAIVGSTVTAGRAVGAAAGKDYGEFGPSGKNWWNMIFDPDRRVSGEDIISGNPDKGLTYGVFKGDEAPAGYLFNSSPHPLVRALAGVGIEAAVDPLNFIAPAGKVHGAQNIAGHITEEFAKKAVQVSGRDLTPEVVEGLVNGSAKLSDLVSLPAGHPQAVELEQLRGRAAHAIEAARRGGASKLTADEIMEFGGGKVAKGMQLDFGPLGRLKLTSGGGPIGAASVWRHNTQMALGDLLLSKGGEPVRFGKNVANAAVEAQARSGSGLQMMDATIARRIRRTGRAMVEASANEAARTSTAAVENVRKAFKLSDTELDDAIEEGHLIIDGGLNPADATPQGVKAAQELSDALFAHAEQRVAGGAASDDTLLERGTYFPSPVTQEGREAMIAAGFHPEGEATGGNALFINQRRKLYDESSGVAGIGLDSETTARITKLGVKNRAEAEQWAGEELARSLKERAALDGEAGDAARLFLAEHPDIQAQVDEGYVRMFKTGREALVAEAKATGKAVARARMGRRLFELGYGIVDPRAVKGYVNYGMTPDGVRDLKAFGENEAERFTDLADAQRDAAQAADEIEGGVRVETPGDLEPALEDSLRPPPEEPPGGVSPVRPPEGPVPGAGPSAVPGATEAELVAGTPVSAGAIDAAPVEGRRAVEADAEAGRRAALQLEQLVDVDEWYMPHNNRALDNLIGALDQAPTSAAEKATLDEVAAMREAGTFYPNAEEVARHQADMGDFMHMGIADARKAEQLMEEMQQMAHKHLGAMNSYAPIKDVVESQTRLAVAEGIASTQRAFADAKQALADIAALPKDDWKEIGVGAAVDKIRNVARDLGISPNLTADETLAAVKAAIKDYDAAPETYAAAVRARIHGQALEDAQTAQYGLDVAGRTKRVKLRTRKSWTPVEKAEHAVLRDTLEQSKRARDDAYTELRDAESELRAINARGPQVVSATNERLDARIAKLSEENAKLKSGLDDKMALDKLAEEAEATRRANENPMGGPEDIAAAMDRYTEGAIRPTDESVTASYMKQRFKSSPAETMTDKRAREAAEKLIKDNERKMERLERMKAESPDTTTVTDADVAASKVDAAHAETVRLKQVMEDAKAKLPTKYEKYGTFTTEYVDQPVEGSPMFEAQRRFEDTVREAEAKELAEPLAEKSERFVTGQSPLRDFETNELVRGYEGTRTSSAAKITARNARGDVVEASTLKAHAARIQEEWKQVAATAQEHEALRDAFTAYKAALDKAIPTSPARDLTALADTQVDRAGILANEPSQVDAVVDDVLHEAQVVSASEVEEVPPTALFENVGGGGPRRGRPGAGAPKAPKATNGPLLGPPTPRRAVPQAYIDAAKRRATDVQAWQKVHTAAREVGDTATAEVARIRILAARLANDADLAHAATRDTLLEVHGIESMWAEAAQHNTLLQKGIADFATHRILAPGILTPNAMVDMVLQSDAIFNDPATMGKFQKSWQSALHWMRVWQITSPGFHIRNMFGGVFNNALHGTDTTSYAEFMALWRKGAAKEGGKLNNEELRIWNMITSIQTPGQVGSEAIGSPLGTLAGNARISRNPIGAVLGSQGVLPRASEMAASNVEFYLRGTLAYDVIKKGGTIDDAAEAIAKFHFDYHDASRGEQWLKNNFVPFLTWTRHNMPLQLEMMIEHPRTYSKFAAFKKNIESASEKDPVVPAYFSDIQAVRLPFVSGGGHVHYIPDAPFRDIGIAAGPIDALTRGEGDLGDRALDALGEPVGMLTPLISGPVEWGLGKQFYKGIPLRGDRGIALKDLHIPNWLAAPLALTPLVQKSSNGRYYITEKDFYILEKELPILGRVRRLGGSSEKKQQDKLVARLISFLAGTQVRTNNKDDQEIANYIDSLETKRKKTISYGLGAPRPTRGGSVL